MTPEERDRVLDGAVAAWEADFEHYSLAAVADASGIDAGTIRAAIGDELDVQAAWYARAVERVGEAARALEQDTPTPSEDRIGARLYMLFDVFDEHREFAHATYSKRAACWGSTFREAVAREVAAVLDAPDVPGVNRAIATSAPVRAAVVEACVHTIGLWIDDESPSRERATALVDRLVSFAGTLATDRTLEKGIDLVRYAAGAGYLPFVGDLFSKKGGDA